MHKPGSSNAVSLSGLFAVAPPSPILIYKHGTL